MRFTYPYATEAAARLSAKVAIKKETTEPKMSKSSKSLSPAKAERRRKRAEQAAGRSAIVKAGLRVEKFRLFVKACGRQQWADVCHASQKSQNNVASIVASLYSYAIENRKFLLCRR